MLIQDLYQECLQYEESSLAHYIYHLLAEGKLTLTDPASNLDLNEANHEVVAELIQNNILGIHPINIYALKKTNREFIFIFAHSPQEAIQFYEKSFYHKPKNCHEYPLEFEIMRRNEAVSFRELRKEVKKFPAFVGTYRKGYGN